MNLFEDIEVENDKYINILDALEFIAKKINYGVSDIARRLLLDKFNQIACMFTINDYGKIELHCSEKLFNGDYVSTTEFLKLAISTLGTFDYIETDTYGNEYKYTKDDWSNYYWLKLDFFEFDLIKKLNIKESDLQIFLNNRSQEFFADFIIKTDIQNHEILNKKNAMDVSKTFFKEQEEFQSNEQIETTHIPLFYLNDTFSLIEASCLLSGDDPIQMNRCFNDTNFDQNYPLFNEAYNFINSAVDAGNLSEHAIPSCQLKTYLQAKGRVIDGFNSSLPVQDFMGCGQPSIHQTEPNTENLNAEIIRLRELINKKDEEINQLQQHQKPTEYTHNLKYLIKESEKDSKIKEQEEKIEQLIVINEQFSNEISFLKKRISAIASLKSTGIVDNQDQGVEETKENYSDLTPEQEIPNARQRNNVLKIISILCEMADLPPEPFTAFNMMDAHATQKSKEIPSKHTIADWLKRARDSN